MQKILEWRSTDFQKGISSHIDAPVGGLFANFIGCDPFERGGVALPSIAPENKVLGTTPKFLTNIGSRTILAQSDTKLYSVLIDSPYTSTDVTSAINQSISGTPIKVTGRTLWKTVYVYAVLTDTNVQYIRCNDLSPLAASDRVLVKGTQGDLDYTALCVGADGNLYYGDQRRVGVITTIPGSLADSTGAGNSNAYWIDDNFYVRDILSDGRYLVIFADNNAKNTTDRVVGKYQCKIYFWDMVQTDANSRIVPDVTWTFDDAYIIGAKITDKGIEVVCYNGIYITNIATEPKMIRLFDTVLQVFTRPLNPSQIDFTLGSLYWVDGFSNVKHYIYAHGNPTEKQKIFYIPYLQELGTYLSTCLIAIGKNIIMGTDQPGLFFFNTGVTRGDMSITTLINTMEHPYTYGYTKVVLISPLASGQSIQVTAISQDSGNTISNETKNYSVANAKQTFLFKRVVTQVNSKEQFEDIKIAVATTGAGIRRISTYATPVEDGSEQL